MTDLMSAPYDFSRMRSFKYGEYNATTKTLKQLDIDNGNVVRLQLPMIDRDLWTAVKPAANTPLEEIALVTTVELPYDERDKDNLWKWFNSAEFEEAATGMLLRPGNIFSVTLECLTYTGNVEPGQIVELQADTKLKIVKTATSGSTRVGEVLDLNIRREGTYVGIKVG